MAHYAQLDPNNKVVSVFTGRDEDDLEEGITDWEEYYAPEGFTVKRTSINTYGNQHLNGGTPFRKNYAGEGYSYDSSRDAFIAPKPFDSWILNEETCLWEAPVPQPEIQPNSQEAYYWNEKDQEWIFQDFSEEN
jgi:hypothetical protein